VTAGDRRSWLLLGLTPLVAVVLALPAGGWLLPLVAPLTLWPAFAPAARDGSYRRAVAAALLWAALLSAAIIALTETAPRLAGTRIVNGEPYRIEMFRWIETGSGRENEPAEFIPQHLLHLAAFALLSWLSAGYLGLALGAGLVAYMSYFVGSFAASSGHPLLGAIVAWVPWSVVRVAAFVVLGSVLARRLLERRPFAFDRRDLAWTGAAFAGIVVDIALKSALAPSYGLFLRRFLQ
jgi:hypothetical protein